MKFPVISIDPPVPYERTAGQGVAHKAYSLMTWQDLKDLGPRIHAVAAPDCAIFLWICPPLLVETVDMVQAWGFRYITKAFTWVKLYPDSGVYVGLGSHTRANSEDVWLLSNGTPHRKSADVSQVVFAQNTRHSQKPEEVQNRIERLMAGPYLELFARRQRPGWTCVGNEVDGLDIRESLARLARDEALPVHTTKQVEQHELFAA